MKKIFFVFLLLSPSVFCQVTHTDFGFSSSKTPLVPYIPIVKPGTNMIATAAHVYYVALVDNKIRDLTFANDSWSGSGTPLGGTSCPSVKNGTNIVNYADEIFFVSSVDSKIYRLKWTSGPGWQYNVVCTSQIPVGGSNITLKVHPSGCEIYYIGNTGKIYQLYFNGTTWFCGTQLSSAQTINALTTSPLIFSSTAVYYIGSPDNKIYRVYWGGTSWTGGATPLVSSSSPVRALSKFVNENNNPDHLYYVDAGSQICELFLNSGSWTFSTIPTGGELVRLNSDIVCSYGSVFYVNGVTNKISRIWKPSSVWTKEVLFPGQENVVANTPISVWANDILEETSTTATFKSFHVFYAGNSNRLNMLVYDDKRVPFLAFGCYDPCDDNNNGTGWDDPPTLSTPKPGYDCSLYNVAGIKAKEWYSGTVSLATSGKYNPEIANMVEFNKHFYFVGFYTVGGGNQIFDFLRPKTTAFVKSGYGSPVWNDEFSGSTLDATKWAKQFIWGNHNPNKCYDIYWNEASNVNLVSNNLVITANNIFSYHGNRLDWYEGCGNYGPYNPPLTYYPFSTGMISSEGKYNIETGSFTEARMQIPRGNRFWPGFWFPYNQTEDINFEFDGNGKVLLVTLYDNLHGGHEITDYAVGFRFYDDFYTYGVSWTTSAITYYVNNEPIGSLANILNHCVTPKPIIFTLELSDANIHAACAPELFPAYYKIDYVRNWLPGRTYTNKPNEEKSIEKTFTVAPNPTKAEITISGSSFSKAEIYNIQGSKVYEGNSQNINVEAFSSGVYIIKIIDENGKVQNSKFIKE